MKWNIRIEVTEMTVQKLQDNLKSVNRYGGKMKPESLKGFRVI